MIKLIQEQTVSNLQVHHLNIAAIYTKRPEMKPVFFLAYTILLPQIYQDRSGPN